MEHRWFKRTPMQINVLMHYPPLGMINGVTKNISSNGMFVDTGRIILISDELISLNFRYPDQLEGEIQTIDAHIIHTSSNGAGLQFLKFQFDPVELQLKYNAY